MLNFGALQIPKRDWLNDNNEEQQYRYFLNGRVCWFITLSAINIPRSSSQSYKLPKNLLNKIFFPPENPEIADFKSKKILRTSPSLEIQSTSSHWEGSKHVILRKFTSCIRSEMVEETTTTEIENATPEDFLEELSIYLITYVKRIYSLSLLGKNFHELS